MSPCSSMSNEAFPFVDRATWLRKAVDLYSITLACMGFLLWNLAGLVQQGGQVEATASSPRIPAGQDEGASLALLYMGGAGRLRACRVALEWALLHKSFERIHDMNPAL